MPDLTITLTTTQVAHLALAFAYLNSDGTPATVRQVEAWIKHQMRRQVRRYEQEQVRSAAEATAILDLATVDTALDVEGWGS